MHIEVPGGGAIDICKRHKTVHIFGDGDGVADFKVTRNIIMSDPKYKEYSVTASKDGEPHKQFLKKKCDEEVADAKQKHQIKTFRNKKTNSEAPQKQQRIWSKSDVRLPKYE